MLDLTKIFSEVKFDAVRSRGPGGQNVNKVSSAALLFWNFETSRSVTIEQKYLIRTKLVNQVNKEGEVFVRSDEFRDLERNKSRCLEKLEDLLARAFFKPKKRRPTRPTAASKKRRLEGKSNRSKIKKLRSKQDYR